MLISSTRKALRQVLEKYEISQSKLAAAIGVSRSVLNGWVIERRTPSSNLIPEISRALQSFDPEAAEEFIQLYLVLVIENH